MSCDETEKNLDYTWEIFYNIITYGNLLLERNFTMAKEYKITSLRLQDLEKELNYLKTTREREIEDENEANGRVGLGCTVVVEDLKTGKQITYTITGSQEANPMEYKLSDDSPFGRAAVGKSIGDIFTVMAPAGSYEMKVLDVTREG